MTSSPHGPYRLGYTRATMAGTTGSECASWRQSLKAGLSSDWRLQLASMKLESLVIAGQNTAVNVFLSLVHTARQATKVGGAQQSCRNPQGNKGPKANSVIGTKS